MSHPVPSTSIPFTIVPRRSFRKIDRPHASLNRFSAPESTSHSSTNLRLSTVPSITYPNPPKENPVSTVPYTSDHESIDEQISKDLMTLEGVIKKYRSKLVREQRVQAAANNIATMSPAGRHKAQRKKAYTQIGISSNRIHVLSNELNLFLKRHEELTHLKESLQPTEPPSFASPNVAVPEVEPLHIQDDYLDYEAFSPHASVSEKLPSISRLSTERAPGSGTLVHHTSPVLSFVPSSETDAQTYHTSRLSASTHPLSVTESAQAFAVSSDEMLAPLTANVEEDSDEDLYTSESGPLDSEHVSSEKDSEGEKSHPQNIKHALTFLNDFHGTEAKNADFVARTGSDAPLVKKEDNAERSIESPNAPPLAGSQEKGDISYQTELSSLPSISLLTPNEDLKHHIKELIVHQNRFLKNDNSNELSSDPTRTVEPPQEKDAPMNSPSSFITAFSYDAPFNAPFLGPSSPRQPSNSVSSMFAHYANFFSNIDTSSPTGGPSTGSTAAVLSQLEYQVAYSVPHLSDNPALQAITMAFLMLIRAEKKRVTENCP